MQEIPKTYDPSKVEEKWYSYWMKNGFFKSTPDEREPYCIVIPPPNVTGVLHMGHMLNNTIQDVLIRRARMLGKNACWVPGTDHASIATEAKVVAMLREKGINKKDLTREEFLKYAWEWKEKYGGIILDQLKKLGASCDWDRTRFTMEEDLSEAVISVFIDLFNKGFIYRGVRMVNWDPAGKTAVSDEEVIHKEVNSKLVYVRYPLIDQVIAAELKTGSAWSVSGDTWNVKVNGKDFSGTDFITIATVRPETILGDTAVCVHPDDDRYRSLKGKFAVIPMVNRPVPIIFDTYIDPEFGTGALKVTPAHDINDYNLGVKHSLEVIDTINDDGTMSAAAGFYIGEERFVVRKKITKDLETSGYVVKVEDYKNKVGYSERTDAVIEPKLSLQWFLKMDAVSSPALENVLNGNIKLIPEKFINTYRHWMENVHDWCISRQLWWGQQIPAWYDEKGRFVVCKTADEAVQLFKKNYQSDVVPSQLRQDEDVLDTWFSSWLWPISVFDGFKDPDNADINYYYPTNDLVTAPEILFFWVARMIIAGYEYMNEKPFTNVYLTGIVRDKLGRKMSKSLGNSPDPLDLITKYSADGVRVGMLLASPAGNDLLFDESLCEQGRNFANKVWNAFRLVKGWTVGDVIQSDTEIQAVQWFREKLNDQLNVINDHYDKYRMSDALMSSYKLIWDDFCSWYLEMVKPEFEDGQSLPVNKSTYESTIGFFEQLMKIIHPWMPFISEELWHLIKDRPETDCIIHASWPEPKVANRELLDAFETAAGVVAQIRNLRQQKNISPKEKLTLVKTESTDDFNFDQVIIKLANLDKIDQTSGKLENAISFMIGKNEYFIPFSLAIDRDAEKDRLMKELEYNRGFLNSVQSKLANERFVSNAKPEVVETERRKQADAEAKIRAIEEQLSRL
jgi:valyl-tRNA synthetase